MTRIVDTNSHELLVNSDGSLSVTLVPSQALAYQGSYVATVANVSGAATYVAQATGSILAAASSTTPELITIDTSLITPVPNKMRLLASYATNATAPGNTMTWGLYPVGTPIGGVGIVNPVLGTVVSGSTAAFVTPSLSTKSSAWVNSGDFTVPAAGLYSLGVVASATMAANSAMSFVVRLEFRYV